ncbi:hypothetical protein X975_02885, partial [Stegodyphus mimosarum]
NESIWLIRSNFIWEYYEAIHVALNLHQVLFHKIPLIWKIFRQ